MWNNSSNNTRKSTLIFCTTINGAKKIVLKDKNKKYFIASDDKRVHDLCKYKYDNITCLFINQGDSYYTVSTKVRNIVEIINNWFHFIESSISNYKQKILFWESHAEGGQTTQRIQDCLILLKSYYYLIDSIDPQEILIINDNINIWENKLIETCANHYEIKVKYIESYSLIMYVKLFYLKFRPLLKEFYFSFTVIRAWINNYFKRINIYENKAVLIQLCDSSDKHLNHTIPLVNAINNVGLQGVVFGWNASNAIINLRKKDILAFELEYFVSFKDLIFSWIETIKLWNFAKNNISKLYNTIDDNTNKKLISIIFKYSFKSFFQSDVPHRHRLRSASNNFFTINTASAIRLWTRVLHQSIIVYNSIPSPNSIIFFWQPGWPYNIDEPLRKYMVPADIIFAISIEHKKRLISDGINENQIFISGLPWLEKISNFSNNTTKQFSRNKIGFSDNDFKFIFFDPGFVLLGIMSLPEQLSQLTTILDFAKENSNVKVIIKPHQGHKVGILEKIISDHNLINVHYYPSNYPIYHLLNSSDLLITKMSTLAIEAMYLKIPTIVAIFNFEKNFMFYEDAVDYAFSSIELKSLLNRINLNSDLKANWRKSINIRMKEYMIRHGISVINTNPNLIIANSLKQNINKSNLLLKKI